MRIPKLPLILIVGAIVGFLYVASIGVSEPIDDFEPNLPEDDPAPPPEPSTVPIAYAWFEYTISVYGILQGAVNSVEPHVTEFISFSEGRIFESKPLFSIPFPDPDFECEAYLVIQVSGNGLSETWTSKIYEVESYPSSFSDVSGRVFFYVEGQYAYTATLMLDSGIIGDARAVATRSGTVQVSL